MTRPGTLIGTVFSLQPPAASGLAECRACPLALASPPPTLTPGPGRVRPRRVARRRAVRATCQRPTGSGIDPGRPRVTNRAAEATAQVSHMTMLCTSPLAPCAPLGAIQVARACTPVGLLTRHIDYPVRSVLAAGPRLLQKASLSSIYGTLAAFQMDGSSKSMGLEAKAAPA
jgi:hypothetical protein